MGRMGQVNTVFVYNLFMVKLFSYLDFMSENLDSLLQYSSINPHTYFVCVCVLGGGSGCHTPITFVLNFAKTNYYLHLPFPVVIRISFTYILTQVW